MSATAAAIKEPPRTSYLGGSDAPSVLGLSPWRSAYRLWCEKSGAEPAPSLDSVEYVQWGKLLEPLVAEEWARRSGKQIRATRLLYRHPAYPFMRGHIDRRILNESALLECKISNAYDARKWGPSGSDSPSDIPAHYLAQIDHYMSLSPGFDRTYLAVLIGGNELRSYTIARSPQREAALVDAERSFWNDFILADVPPPILSEADARHRWAGIAEGTSVAVALDVKQRVMRLKQVQDELSALESEEKTIRNFLFPLFTDAETLNFNGDPIARLHLSQRDQFYPKELAADKSPGAKRLYKKYSHPLTIKRLKVLV